MLIELLQHLMNGIHSETPSESGADTGTTDTPQIVELQDDVMYKLPEADEPIDGKTLRSRQMMQSDYTKKTQSLSDREKLYQQQLSTKDSEIEKLKNQVLSMQLDDKFQTQASGNQQNAVTENIDEQDVNNLDWLYNDNPAPTQQAQQGINSTPQNNLSLSDISKALLQLPDFRQSFLDELRADNEKARVADRQQRMQEQEDLEANLQIEADYKQKFGQKGLDLMYAMEHARRENDTARFFELQEERDKLAGQQAIEQYKKEEEQREVEAVEQAMSGPTVVEQQENETKQQRARRVKKEVTNRARALKGKPLEP